MVKFKDGVMLQREICGDHPLNPKGDILLPTHIQRVQPVIWFAISQADQIYRTWAGLDICLVTALLDGEHMKGSKHYQGMAVDLRLPSVEANMIGSRYSEGFDTRILGKIVESLGRSFDCLLEKDHIHIEYDPKY